MEIFLRSNLSESVISDSISAAVGKFTCCRIIIHGYSIAHRSVRCCSHNHRNAASLQDSLHIIGTQQRIIRSRFTVTGIDSHIYSHIVARADGQQNGFHPSFIVITYGITARHAMVCKSSEDIRHSCFASFHAIPP